MITAKQAYANYLTQMKIPDLEKFVKSVLKYVITDERILEKSVCQTELTISIWDIFNETFLKKREWNKAVFTHWRVDCSEVPETLKGKSEFGVMEELETMYKTEPDKSFICKAFRRLIYELEVVRGFKVAFKPEQRILTVSWDLSSNQNT